MPTTTPGALSGTPAAIASRSRSSVPVPVPAAAPATISCVGLEQDARRLPVEHRREVDDPETPGLQVDLLEPGRRDRTRRR